MLPAKTGANGVIENSKLEDLDRLVALVTKA